MKGTNQLKNQHLLWRAGFGPMAEDLDALATARQKAFLNALWKGSAGDPSPVGITDDALKNQMMGMGEVGPMQRKEMSADEKKEMRRQSEQDIRALNLAWLNEMVNSDAQLREKMSLFWHGHFASRVQHVFYQQSLLDTIRKNALGNFGDLLKQVSASASMINFLNNNQNKKDHPNENFAREVMELFTMGRGNYTEQDVKEGARAFTGWGANVRGDFEFRKRQHDDGQKSFLGKTGNFDGNDVLNMLLEQKATASYVTRKLYRYLVNEEVDDTKVEWLAGRWYQSNYDIRSLLEDIFGSEWFYEDRNIGCRIKSPIDLLVGIRRLLPMRIENEEVQLVFQRLLGQVLMYPPNVAGWPGGASWIDSSSLMFRLQLPQLIYKAEEFGQQPKDDDDRMMGMTERPGRLRVGGKPGGGKGLGKGGQIIQAEIDWTAYLQRFAKIPDGELLVGIEGVVLQTGQGIGDDTLRKYAVNGSREEFIKTATIRLMSTPEYQLC
jgi:uncharacterized protein (DUF1800 family)